MQSHFEADRHNFGRAVEIQGRASGIWFQKPRSVFWEYLFFGKESPLKGIFDAVGPNGSVPPSKYLFNLEVDQETIWSGAAREVKGEDIVPTLEHYYAFGVLLAYSYLFGIRDLHRFNLVLTATHLQAVDAEVVLTDLVLPHETVLLPFKDVSLQLSGISRLVDSLESVSESQGERLCAGFIDLLSMAFQKYDDLKLKFAESNPSSFPIRVIIRNTGPYRAHLLGEDQIKDVLPEEKSQLDRSDVPYFCKRIGDEALYWVSSSDFSLTAVKELGNLEKDVRRHAVHPDILLPDSKRIHQRLVHGLLFLQRKIVVPPTQYSFNGRVLKLQNRQMVFNNPAEIYSSQFSSSKS